MLTLLGPSSSSHSSTPIYLASLFHFLCQFTSLPFSFLLPVVFFFFYVVSITYTFTSLLAVTTVFFAPRWAAWKSELQFSPFPSSGVTTTSLGTLTALISSRQHAFVMPIDPATSDGHKRRFAGIQRDHEVCSTPTQAFRAVGLRTRYGGRSKIS
jgi:hypothetical protein